MHERLVFHNFKSVMVQNFENSLFRCCFKIELLEQAPMKIATGLKAASLSILKIQALSYLKHLAPGPRRSYFG